MILDILLRYVTSFSMFQQVTSTFFLVNIGFNMQYQFFDSIDLICQFRRASCYIEHESTDGIQKWSNKQKITDRKKIMLASLKDHNCFCDITQLTMHMLTVFMIILQKSGSLSNWDKKYNDIGTWIQVDISIRGRLDKLMNALIG